jgi:hypothetical protein
MIDRRHEKDEIDYLDEGYVDFQYEYWEKCGKATGVQWI